MAADQVKDRLEEPQESAQLDISNSYQKYHWDCGIACAQMVLSYVLPKESLNEEDFDEMRRRLMIGHSIWTIDLAHMMHHLGVKHHFFTITLGVDPRYSAVDFYTKRREAEIFTEEEKRINELFSRASEVGIKVEKRSVTKEELILHLSAKNPAIMLMDSSILRCLNCDKKLQDVQCNCCVWTNPSPTGQYQGHFVVLCGYSKPKRQFFFKNPTFHADLCASCCCSFDNFDKSRRSHGTDEDVLLIYR